MTKITNFGAFVELEDDIDGLVHISQISEDRVEKVKDALKVGQEVEARVIKVDKAERRIGLSIKAAHYDHDALRREAELSTPCVLARTWSAWPRHLKSPRRNTVLAIQRKRNELLRNLE